MQKNILSEFFVLSHAPEGGAYHYTLTADGTLLEGNKITVPNAMWSEISGGRLCIAFRGAEDSPISKTEGYAEYSLTSGSMLGGIFPTHGDCVCHFTKADNDVYFANYLDGTVCQKMPDGGAWVIGHVPTDEIPLGCDLARQERPHAHQCLLSPDKKYLLVCDLGLDCVFVYDRNLAEVSHAKIPSGHGTRHAVFSKDGTRLFVLGEMGVSVTEFLWDNGTLTCRGTLDLRGDVPIIAPEEGGAAIVLSPDGQHLYATDRGTDTIVHLRVNDVGLTILSRTPSGGRHPRDFRLIADGRVGVCCNQFGNNFSLFTLNPDGDPVLYKTVSLPEPLCVSEI